MPLDLDRLGRITDIDITTTGRRSGRSSRVEICWYRVDGRFVITGTPGPRDWYANIVANPEITVHVDGRNLRARAVPIVDPDVRAATFRAPEMAWFLTRASFDDLVASAPMVVVHLHDA